MLQFHLNHIYLIHFDVLVRNPTCSDFFFCYITTFKFEKMAEKWKKCEKIDISTGSNSAFYQSDFNSMYI